MRVTIDQASQLLIENHVVAVPTETVYGLAASLVHPAAIERIFAIKGRPSNNPLIVHLSSKEQATSYSKNLPCGFEDLAAAFWPGPMTVIVEADPAMIPSTVRAGLSTVAFRVPSHQLALDLMQHTGPLVMPSANLSGKPSATCADHVEADFGLDFPVLDGGECVKGLESTILMFQEGKWKIVRLGALAPQMFVSILGYCPEVEIGAKGHIPLCPGQLYKHYAPKAELFLTQAVPSHAGGIVIGFSDRSYPKACRLLALSHSKDPEAAAQRLYAMLRQLDCEGITQAWVDMDFPAEGLWLTLKERLFKASQK